MFVFDAPRVVDLKGIGSASVYPLTAVQAATPP